MQQVDIYLWVSTRAPKAREAEYRYLLTCGNHRVSGRERVTETTGHRLVLQCAIAALGRMVRPAVITVHTDCRLLINSHAYLQRWAADGWSRQNGEPVKNVDLWKLLVEKEGAHAIRYHFDSKQEIEKQIFDKEGENGNV